jgi:hypothetical protein
VRSPRRPKGFQRISTRTQEESERSWRLAIGGRFRVNDYACGTRPHNNNTFTWSGPSGVFGCIGQRPGWPLVALSACQTPLGSEGCHAVPLNAAESPGGENLRGGKRLRLRFWKGCLLQHTYSFALNHPLVASLRLCSPLVLDFGLPLDVRPSPLDSPVLLLVVWEPFAP